MGAATIEDRAVLHLARQDRAFTLSDVEVRGDATDGYTFDGTASVVDAPYKVRDMFGEFTETIKAGAFNKALRDKADVALFVNHRHADVPMATTRAGTLKLTADPHLRAVAGLDPVRPDVIIARSAVNRGELPEMSIGFTVNANRDKWNKDMTERVITEVNLIEVSIVRQGANPFTGASMRSFEEWMDSVTDIDMTEADIRRAFTYFESRLPHEAEDEINPFAERDRADLERLERKRLLRPPAYA